MGYGYPPILAIDFDGTIKKSNELNDYDSELNHGCKEILIRLKDKGCKFILWTCRAGEYLEKAKEPLFSTLPEEERAGLGFTIMEVFSDDFEIESTVNEGTKVHMVKRYEDSDLTYK